MSHEVSTAVVLTLEGAAPDALDGRTFQVHVKGPHTLLLYPVEVHADTRCPVVVGGERCGGRAGHEGKHCWGSGD